MEQYLIDRQRDRYDNLYTNLERTLIYLSKINNFNTKYKNNIIDKFSLLNSKIDEINEISLEILIDFKNKKSIKNNKLIQYLNEQEYYNKKIKKLYPILLLNSIFND